MQFSPCETAHLYIREYRKTDLDGLYMLLSDPAVTQYAPFKPATQDEAALALEERLQNTTEIVLEEKSSSLMIGSIYFCETSPAQLEMRCLVHSTFWHKGYAAEACHAIIAMAFANGIHRIYTQCDPDNKAGCGLCHSIGFKEEAHLRDNVYYWMDESGSPLWKDTLIYAMLESEYRRANYRYELTDGSDPAFHRLCTELNKYLHEYAAGESRQERDKYNHTYGINHVIIVYKGKKAVACGALRNLDGERVEMKRIFIRPEERGNHIGQEVIMRLEEIARSLGYKEMVLETDERLTHAVALYYRMGYKRIACYGPYVNMPEALCMGKQLPAFGSSQSSIRDYD